MSSDKNSPLVGWVIWDQILPTYIGVIISQYNKDPCEPTRMYTGMSRTVGFDHNLWWQYIGATLERDLGGGFKDVLFSNPTWGFMIQFDEHICFKWVGSTTN